MNDQKEYTVRDVLGFTKDALNSIALPASYLRELNVISGCISNIDQCIDAIDKANQPNSDNVIDLGVINLGEENGNEEDNTK